MAARSASATDFGTSVGDAYATDGAAIELGLGVHEGALVPEAGVRVPLRMMNRHGLIAGATGTGKTRTLQLIAEQLSAAGVAVFAADVKGGPHTHAPAACTHGPGGRCRQRCQELTAVSEVRNPARQPERREMLAARLEQAAPTDSKRTSERQKKAAEATGGGADAIGDFLKSSTGKTIQRELVRGLFGLLKRKV